MYSLGLVGPEWSHVKRDLAERVGFEPTVRKTVLLISSQARSTSPAPLLALINRDLESPLIGKCRRG